MPSVAAARFLSSALTATEWKQFQADDPKSALRWAASVAVQAGAPIDGLPALRGLSDADAFDPAVAKQVFDFVDAKLMGATQAARAATLGWTTAEPVDPPALTGRLEMRGEQVMLNCEGRLLPVVNTGSACWGSDASAFLGQVVTMKGWPDANGRLMVEEFAPGSSTDFVHGRVEKDAQGNIGIRVRGDKRVEITDVKLAAALAQVPGAGVILPGPVSHEGNTYRFTGSPGDYYLLTALDHATGPGSYGARVAHNVGELKLTAAAGTRSDLLDSRRFVYGHVGANLSFDARWVSPPAWAAVWSQPSGTAVPDEVAAAKVISADAVPTVPFAPASGRWAPAPRVYADGVLMRELSHAEVYLIVGGAKVHVPNPAELTAMQLDGRPIRVVPDRTMGTVPDVPADGSLIRERGAQAVFVIVGGAKLWVPSPDQLNKMGLEVGLILTMPAGKNSQVPDVPLDGTLLKELSSPETFIMDGGKKRPITPDGIAALGRSLAEVQTAPDGSLSPFVNGDTA